MLVGNTPALQGFMHPIDQNSKLDFKDGSVNLEQTSFSTNENLAISAPVRAEASPVLQLIASDISPVIGTSPKGSELDTNGDASPARELNFPKTPVPTATGRPQAQMVDQEMSPSKTPALPSLPDSGRGPMPSPDDQVLPRSANQQASSASDQTTASQRSIAATSGGGASSSEFPANSFYLPPPLGPKPSTPMPPVDYQSKFLYGTSGADILSGAEGEDTFL
jgi:hypothetical protein